VGLLLLKAVHLNSIIFVLQNLKLLFVVEKVHTLASINFKHRHIKLSSGERLRYLENIVYCVFCYRIDRECFSGACLPICKTRDNTTIKNGRHQIPNRKLVHVLRILIFIESIIELEVSVLDVLCNAVNLNFGLVHYNVGVRRTYTINFPHVKFFIEKRPFPDTDANVHFRRAHVI